MRLYPHACGFASVRFLFVVHGDVVSVSGTIDTVRYEYFADFAGVCKKLGFFKLFDGN